LENPTIEALKEHCRKNGNKTLKQAGYEKVLKNMTIIEEIHRVVSLDI
jgi:type II secretory ATPase GspE/PulE/Tfp pilus assembly ATPase PilB-like protein